MGDFKGVVRDCKKVKLALYGSLDPEYSTCRLLLYIKNVSTEQTPHQDSPLPYESSRSKRKIFDQMKTYFMKTEGFSNDNKCESTRV